MSDFQILRWGNRLSFLILFHLANFIIALPGRRESVLHAERSQR